MAQGSLIYMISSSSEPLRQGEILSNLLQLPLDPDKVDLALDPEKGEDNRRTFIQPVYHPFSIVVSQDCDLDWDFKARKNEDPTQRHKLLPNILFCMVTTAEELRGRSDMKSDIWKRVKGNKDERYHFFQKVEPAWDLLGQGLPELGADFKRYFTIPTNEVYFQLEKSTANRRCRLASPYLEHFASRFSYYLSRVALPEDHYSEPVN